MGIDRIAVYITAVDLEAGHDRAQTADPWSSMERRLPLVSPLGMKPRGGNPRKA